MQVENLKSSTFKVFLSFMINLSIIVEKSSFILIEDNLFTKIRKSFSSIPIRIISYIFYIYIYIYIYDNCLYRPYSACKK